MQYKKVSSYTYFIRLEKGESVIKTLHDFCNKHAFFTAHFSALGSVENPLVAHYRVDTKKYSEKKLSGIFEVTAMLGNISRFENKSLVHTHITLSDEEMKAFGGHLVEAIVSATVEVHLTITDEVVEKKFNEEIGLKLWDFKN